MAQNHVVGRPASMCPAHAKPAERRPCNPKACSPDDVRPRIDANEESHVTEAKPSQKQVSVKIGGSAAIYLGTRLKIRCPVKRFNRFVRGRGSGVARPGLTDLLYFLFLSRSSP